MLLSKLTNIILIKNLARPLLISSRCYPGMKHEVYDYIQWVRPPKIPSTDPSKSGDLSAMRKIDPKEFMLNFENSKLLENASEQLRSKFSVELNPRKESIRVYVDEMIKKVQRHEQDYGSMEAKLAKMTAKIRAGQAALEENPKNKKMKQKLKELIERRKKFLKHLRRYDYKRFEYMLEQLDIKYTAPPDRFHWIARKDAMKALTRRFCKNIKENRLEEYKQMLQAQQLDFLANKIKNLEFIRQEQIECKIPVTISTEQINKVKKQYETLKVQREEEEIIRKKNEVRDDYEIKL